MGHNRPICGPSQHDRRQGSSRRKRPKRCYEAEGCGFKFGPKLNEVTSDLHIAVSTAITAAVAQGKFGVCQTRLLFPDRWLGWYVHPIGPRTAFSSYPNVDFKGSWAIVPPFGFHFPPFGFHAPLWFPFLIFFIPSLMLYRRSRAHPPGHCKTCGYNLTGNVSGVCPECGVKIG